MINEQKFEDFLNSLQKTNANLSFFVDFEKCCTNVNKISMKLHSLNYLLGKYNLKEAINELFFENKDCFSVLNLLIAVRDGNTVLINNDAEFIKLNTYFKDPNQIYEFFCQTGLSEIFINSKITNLNDYVFGIEIGLDTNARKNRGGKNFANLIGSIFKQNNLNFDSEVSTNNLNIQTTTDKKIFDFVVYADKVNYLVEVNFYNTGGSKLNEVARSYIEISKRISIYPNFRFVWITDGLGWLSAKNKLEEAYKSIEIYNLSNLNHFIEKVKSEI
ncbi:type II restriction endonuclease [Campylobacter sputorum]|uniref:type II restriction endonuclease n=1 Tax=Campylobacter sputorum TaxID=206 RepID=UPI0035AC0A63